MHKAKMLHTSLYITVLTLKRLLKHCSS